MFHVVYRNKSNPAEEVGQMEQIEVKVTSVPRAGQTVLLIECSACGPVSVDSRPDALVASAGAHHLFHAHLVAAREVGP